MLYSLPHGFGNFVSLQSYRLPERHLDGCASIHEEVAGTGQQGECCHATNSGSNRQADAGVEALPARASHAGSQAIRWRPSASRWESAGDCRARTSYGVANQRSDTGASTNESQRGASTIRPGIFQRVAISGLERDRASDRRDVTVREGDRHRLQVQLRASAFAVESIDRALHECAGRDSDLIAGVDRVRDLGIDVVSAMNVPALDRVREHERDHSSGRDRDRRELNRSLVLGLVGLRGLIVWRLRLILREAGKRYQRYDGSCR
jgi:hypothetical protein